MSDFDTAIAFLKEAAKQCEREGKGLVELLLWRGERIEELESKNADLRHDIERFAEINSEIATELMKSKGE